METDMWIKATMPADSFFSIRDIDGGYIVDINFSLFSPQAVLAWNDWNYYMQEQPAGWEEKVLAAARVFYDEVDVLPDTFWSLLRDLEEKLNLDLCYND